MGTFDTIVECWYHTNVVGLHSGKNLYNNEHVAIKLVSLFNNCSLLLFVLSVDYIIDIIKEGKTNADNVLHLLQKVSKITNKNSKVMMQYGGYYTWKDVFISLMCIFCTRNRWNLVLLNCTLSIVSTSSLFQQVSMKLISVSVKHTCHSAMSPRAGSGVVRMDPLRFLAGCRTRRLNQA